MLFAELSNCISPKLRRIIKLLRKMSFLPLFLFPRRPCLRRHRNSSKYIFFGFFLQDFELFI
jgi:hypothetical protein